MSLYCSVKVTATAEIALWREAIAKEQKGIRMNTEFSIPIPTKMQGITEKPTRYVTASPRPLSAAPPPPTRALSASSPSPPHRGRLPRRVDPAHAVDLTKTQAARDLLEGLSQHKHAEQLPNQKYKIPVTSSMEYGWSPAQLMPRDEIMFHHTKKQCDVTNYADAYYDMTGRSPYAAPAQPK